MAKDPNAAWREAVALARQTRTDIELILEYKPPSEYAGRKLRLFYDAATDHAGHEWLD